MSRSLLQILIKLMFTVLIASFVYVLLVGIGKNNGRESEERLFDAVSEGQSQLLRVQGKYAWVTRLSDTQKMQLKEFNAYLSYPENGCQLSAEVCVVFAETQSSGINLSFSSKPPPQLPNGYDWVGGFVDPTTGATFDLLGRSFKLGLATDVQGVNVLEY